MLTRKVYNDGEYVAYAYNAEGSLARLSYGDSTGELASYRFEYDSLGRLIRSAELDADGGTVQRTEHIYDGYNRLSRQSWTLGGKTYFESYVYDDPSDTNKNGDGALTQMTTATGAVIDYQYDTLRRLTRSEVALNGSAIYTTAYAFRDLDASRTTTQVQYRNVRNANGEVLEGKKYTYDALGNITRISQSTKPFYTLVAYEYDAQNQLTKETYYNGNGTAAGNITRTISYTYDTAGNILSVTETAGDKTTTKAYTYGDSEWLDLLTAINGSAIQYDAGGNPTNWNNGKADLSLQWANGRRLTGASSESARKSESLSYAYDADGVRTSKSYTVLPVYTVTFVADSQTVKTMSVKDGYVLQDRDYPTVPEKSGYAGSWTKYTAAIHENITIQAVYSTGTHTVKFLGLRLSVIKTMTVEDGYVLKSSDYPAVPKKKGFIGKWNTYDDPIHSDITITATYVRDDGTMSLEETEEYDLGSDGGAAAGSDISKPVIYRVVTHEYLTQSGKVMRETIKTNQTVTAVLDFIYDESGKPFAMIDQLSAQPKTYYYVLNLQGDVVKLVTDSGAVAASYEYDAWGNILSQSGSMADVNPLRYRGYYYDSETGFYYLQSRYYDPATRRFINADALTSTGQGFIGTNMFAYCNNNSVNGYDPSGLYNLSVNVMTADTGRSDVIPDPISYPIGTINGQGLDPYADIPFGLSTVGDAGCSAIACYNAMWLIGKKPTLRYVLDYFECHFNPRWFGVMPTEIGGFLDDHSIAYSNLGSFAEVESALRSGGGVAIITFWNGTFQDDSGNPIAINPFKGAHTVAVTATVSGKIKVYNSTGRVRYACEFDNLQNYIDSGVFISAYYIEK